MAAVILDGVDDLMAQLETLPTRLAEQAQPVIEASAHRMADTVRAAYPDRTGDLQRGVQVQHASVGAEGVRYVVANTARHAVWYEYGTQTRQTHAGWNRGAMPPAHVFIPAAERERARMYTEVRAVLEAEGLTVTGSAP